MLSIKNLSVKLDKFSLWNINLEVEKGDYYVLAGPSGSGKTILLETIAGLHEKHTTGEIIFNNENLRSKKMQDRKVGLVFQDNTLFPHLSVKKNIEFAIKRRQGNNKNTKLFQMVCEQLFLFDLLDKNTNILSGGEIRRVLLARTLASNPDILLLDEPLTGVDTFQKDQLKTLLRKIKRSGQTIVHVTHDFEEAYSLANKMGIMHQGKMVSQGTPQEVLAKPGNKFVARFCGFKNYFEATRATTELIQITDGPKLKYAGNKNTGQKLGVLIDESKIQILPTHQPPLSENVFAATAKDIFNSVKGLEMVVDIGQDLSIILTTKIHKPLNIQIGDKIFVYIPESAISVIEQ